MRENTDDFSVKDDFFPAAMGIIEHYLKFAFKDNNDKSDSLDDNKEWFQK